MQPHEVVVVDDASTDATATVATAHHASVVRLDGDPPHGWTGKANACAHGAAAVTGDVLLFLDADVAVAPDTIDRLVAALDRYGGLVSVQPHHRVVRPYEELSATCNVVALMGSGAFAPWPPPPAVGYGPCLVTSVADYRHVGGHGAVRSDVIEDTALARRYAAAGGRSPPSPAATPCRSACIPTACANSWTDGRRASPPAPAGQRTRVIATAWWVTSCLAFGLRGIDALVHAGSVSGSRRRRRRRRLARRHRRAALDAAARRLVLVGDGGPPSRADGRLRRPVRALHVAHLRAPAGPLARAGSSTVGAGAR